MYKRVNTVDNITMDNGSQAEPVASLADEHGGMSHWILDDGCYVLVNMARLTQVRAGSSFQLVSDPVGKMVAWIYPEALEVLRTLPPLRVK